MAPYAKNSTRVLRLAGEYELNLSVYDWDTGFSHGLAGTLQTELSNQASEGVQELVWTWSFVVTDGSGTHESEDGACEGETLQEFLLEVEGIHQLSVSPDEVLEKIKRIKGFRPYVQRLGDAYRQIDIAAQTTAAAAGVAKDAEVATWMLRPEVQRVLDSGFFVAPGHDLSPALEIAVGRSDQQCISDLVALGAVPSFGACWPNLIARRDVEVLRAVAEKMDVNASIRTFTWHGVYRQETPLTLALSASWTEAVELLISAGAKTEDVVSYTDSGGRTNYHDLLPMITKLGVHVGGGKEK